jgi:hypothetical protein
LASADVAGLLSDELGTLDASDELADSDDELAELDAPDELAEPDEPDELAEVCVTAVMLVRSSTVFVPSLASENMYFLSLE